MKNSINTKKDLILKIDKNFSETLLNIPVNYGVDLSSCFIAMNDFNKYLKEMRIDYLRNDIVLYNDNKHLDAHGIIYYYCYCKDKEVYDKILLLLFQYKLSN